MYMRERNITSLSSELFMELASESRLSILMTLKDRHSKLSTLTRIHSTSVGCFSQYESLTKEGIDADGLFCSGKTKNF